MLDEEGARLRNAVAAIRAKTPFYRNVPIVYIPEVNPGHNTSFAPFHLSELNDVLTMREMPGDNFGVPKTDLTTYQMFFRFSEMLLSGEECEVRFCDHLFSLSKTPKDIKRIMIEQCEAYSFEVDERTGRVKLSGKKGGKNDDLMIAVMMPPFWKERFVRRSRFFEPYMQFTEFIEQVAHL